jgi:hypothetical protein
MRSSCHVYKRSQPRSVAALVALVRRNSWSKKYGQQGYGGAALPEGTIDGEMGTLQTDPAA